MRLVPTLDRVVIRRDTEEAQTSGGIILPEDAKKESNFGEVIAVGPGAFLPDGQHRPIRLSLGQRVLFTDYHTTKAGGKDIVIVDEEDVLAVVED